MQETKVIMGMPVTVAVAELSAGENALAEAFAYFTAVDERFSTYKEGSEIMRINRGEVLPENYSEQMQEVFALAEKTKKETNGFFDITKPDGSLDPSGIVKGWAIQKVAELLAAKGFENFFVDAGGDIQSHGKNSEGKEWSVGVRNPFKREEIVKVLHPHGAGVATSGTYIRGAHIYNPHAPAKELHELVSLTIVGPNVLEADRFATAAFAMGRAGIAFIENLPGFEAYAIDREGVATMTSGFKKYTTALK